LNEFKVLSSKFFKNNFDDAEVYLNNTSVNIKNFPLDSFKQWFNGDCKKLTNTFNVYS
jgi:hypothetical protein